jgi:biotin operon repressor
MMSHVWKNIEQTITIGIKIAAVIKRFFRLMPPFAAAGGCDDAA